MFLPVLLVRDFGIAGWLVCAIPNVIGAALMGWILPSRRMSEILTGRHQAAALAFSGITIAFHFFFVTWLIRSWWGTDALWLFGVVIIVSLVAMQALSVGDRIVAVLAWCISMFLIIGNESWRIGGLAPRHRPEFDLLTLAPVCIFGFALCPYLDLTFHRARRATSANYAKVEFGAGFGIFFLFMLVLTFRYDEPMWYLLKDGYFSGSDAFILAVAIHLTVQSGVTVAFHGREVLQRRPILAVSGWTVLAISCAAAALTGWSVNNLSRSFGLNSGEVIYRLFLSFYALFFPAYVWLCMIPGRGRVKPNARQIIVWAIACVVAAPMYWMGFIEGKMIWLLPGLGIVLLARVFVPSVAATRASPPATC